VRQTLYANGVTRTLRRAGDQEDEPSAPQGLHRGPHRTSHSALCLPDLGPSSTDSGAVVDERAPWAASLDDSGKGEEQGRDGYRSRGHLAVLLSDTHGTAVFALVSFERHCRQHMTCRIRAWLHFANQAALVV
jgi:hypothetical protein